MSATLSALVLNYRSPREVIRCVEALQKQTIAGQMEILIIDNHSDDESMGWVRARFQSRPQIRIIESNANIGYGRGNNLAGQFANGEYLLIINPDNTLPPDGVERMLAIAKSNPKAGIIGPALVHPDGTLRASARPLPTAKDLIVKRLFPEKWHRKYQNSDIGHQTSDRSPNTEVRTPKQVDWLVGACLLLRHDLFQKLGGFDERFFLFFEDIDLCRRVRQMGYEVLYAPEIRVQDRKNRLSEGGVFTLLSKKTARIHLVSAVKYFWKWKGTPTRSA